MLGRASLGGSLRTGYVEIFCLADNFSTIVDDDLNAMYLTDKKNNTKREMQDHEELEFLLESFSKQVEEIVSEVGNMDVRPRSLSKVGGIILTLHRTTLNPRKRS